MEYEKKLISLSKELAERLSKESNSSAVVRAALEKYYAGVDASRALIKLADGLTEAVNSLEYKSEEILESTMKANRAIKRIEDSINKF